MLLRLGRRLVVVYRREPKRIHQDDEGENVGSTDGITAYTLTIYPASVREWIYR